MKYMKRNYFKRLFFVFFLSLFVAVPTIAFSTSKSETTSAEETVKLEVNVSEGGIFRMSLQGEDQTKEMEVEAGKSYSASIPKDTPLVISAEANEGYGIEYVKKNGTDLENVLEGGSNFSYIQNTEEDLTYEVKFKEVTKETKNNGLDLTTELTDEDTKVLEDYVKGNYKEYSDYRLEVAKEIGLEDYLNKDNFINLDKFLQKYPSTTFNLGRMQVLNSQMVKGYTTDYQSDYNSLSGSVKESESLGEGRTAQFKVKATTLAEARIGEGVYVTSHEMVTWYNGAYTGVSYSSLSNGLWNMSNGRPAFCAEGINAEPQNGMGSASFEVDNANCRKIMYYGYGGPANCLGDLTREGQIVVTDDCISYAYSGSSIGTVTLNGFHWNKAIAQFYNRLVSHQDPVIYGWTAVGCRPPGQAWSWYPQPYGSTRSFQVLMWAEQKPMGKVKIQKSSANTAVTDNNPCYSLEGAQYGLYTDSGCTNQIGTFTIDASGNSNEIGSLNYQTYYVKETKAPTGYDLDTTVYSINVNSGNTFTVDVKEKPTMPQPPALVSKQDYETGSKPQGSATFKGAEFTVKYYKVYSDNPTGTPAKTWVMRTNGQGIIELKSQYKVSGDDFYYDNGAPVLPYGTITIQETKAPNGYHLDNTVTVKQNKPQGLISTTTVKDLVTRVKLVKIQSGNHTRISDAKFKHTLPNGSTETVTTGNNGEVVLNGLQVGTHKLVETYAPDGYDINTKEIIFEVDSKGNVIPSGISELNKNGIDFVLDDKNNGTLTVEDKVSPFDLKINKVNEKGKKLAGAEFTLYSDANCTKALQRFETDDEGVLTFSNLQTETTYYFKETKAPKGYRIPVDSNGNVHVYEVRVDSTPQNNVFNFTVDGIDYTVNNVNINDPVHLEGTKKDRVVSVQVINFTGNKLPITGDDGTIQMLVSGGVVLSGLLLIVLKRKRSVA